MMIFKKKADPRKKREWESLLAKQVYKYRRNYAFAKMW